MPWQRDLRAEGQAESNLKNLFVSFSGKDCRRNVKFSVIAVMSLPMKNRLKVEGLGRFFASGVRRFQGLGFWPEFSGWQVLGQEVNNSFCLNP